ncbi:MAG TPA: RNA polymerase sigma-70 factor [Tepidiformaceae bacterium]|nr:RNA polymerase sigma-70 factor [Tepidiformaceae bacterium]
MQASAHPSDTLFEEHRRLMFGVAYRMLGSVQEAEDAVQDAYLRYRGAGVEPDHPKAYFTTITTRLCMDRLKSARMKREEYIGVWLPEPLIERDGDPLTPESLVAREADVSMAFLMMLERLGPIERAVFLLREVFDYDYAEIAPVVERSEAACRQAFRRAREHVAEERRRFHPSAEEARMLTARFAQAVGEGDVAGLIELLHHDAVIYSDGGGKVAAALNPVFGADRVARYAIGVTKKTETLRVESLRVNGVPGLALYDERDRIHSILVADIHDGRMASIYVVRNPDKLRMPKILPNLAI